MQARYTGKQMSQQEFIILIGLIIGGFAIVIWFINQKIKESREQDKSQETVIEWIKSTQKDLQQLQTDLTKTLQQSDKNVTDTLQKSYKELNDRLDNAAKVIGDLKVEQGKFTEIGRSMKELQDFLKSPKLRGNLGEEILKDLIAQKLPPQMYTLQYKFESGDIVDAAIKSRAGIICIDSKFPMENYTKMTDAGDTKETKKHRRQFVTDVRKHIRDIAQKYIRTEEGTLDFALMYIPSESIYYYIMTHKPQEVYDYARDRRVLPVSPTTFYAYLQTILISYEGQQIAEKAKLIVNSLRDIQKSSSEFGEKLKILSGHLTNAYNKMTDVSGDYNQLQVKIDTTRQLEVDPDEAAPQIESDT